LNEEERMNGRRFVVAAGAVEQVLARASLGVIERAAHAVLLEATPPRSRRCRGPARG
jgi:hypothetical protein